MPLKTRLDRMLWFVEQLGGNRSELSARAGLDRNEINVIISRLEASQSKAGLSPARAKLFEKEFGVSARWLLDGTGEPGLKPQLLERASENRETTPDVDHAGEAGPVADEETIYETALFSAMDPKRYQARDFDAAREAIRRTHRDLAKDTDPAELARDYLDAALYLRHDGRQAPPLAIVARVASARVPDQARRQSLAAGHEERRSSQSAAPTRLPDSRN